MGSVGLGAWGVGVYVGFKGFGLGLSEGSRAVCPLLVDDHCEYHDCNFCDLFSCHVGFSKFGSLLGGPFYRSAVLY